MTTTRVTFENHGTEPVRVFWVNAGGLEQLIMPRIGPAQVMAMNASPGHELRCRGSLTSILLQVINVGIGPEQRVHVDQSGASTAGQADTKPTALPAAAVESDEAQEAKRAAQESDGSHPRTELCQVRVTQLGGMHVGFSRRCPVAAAG